MKNRDVMARSLTSAYYKVPDKLYKSNLSLGAIALYGYLMSCSEAFNPSGNTIAKSLKSTRATVYKYLQELQKRNMILLIERGGINKISKYAFTKLEEWK